jgi:hypothetical protein
MQTTKLGRPFPVASRLSGASTAAFPISSSPPGSQSYSDVIICIARWSARGDWIQDLADSIAFALNFSGRKRVHDSDTFMARITADRIVRHLERSGY